MASSNHGGRENRDDQPSGVQPIPLQDLSRPADAGERGRRRTSSAASRFLSRRSLVGGASFRNYERISDASPIVDGRVEVDFPDANARASPYVDTTAENPQQNDHHNNNTHAVDDLGGFARAMSSVGLSFESPQQRTTPLSRFPSGSYNHDDDMDTVPLDTYTTFDESDQSFPAADTNEDTAPLTDRRYLQPISGAAAAAHADLMGDDRSDRTGSRLGDDLPHLESGLGGRRRGSASTGDRSRSLSPSAASASGAIHRASSMMKSMSQRIVNLSNEPEVVEQSIIREEQWKNSRLDAPPSLPAMSEYAHDSLHGGGIFTSRSSAEKRSTGTAWRIRNNPLRGKSLGILSPTNPIRTRLCDVLVHPFTEPFILVVIFIQTILLAIESSKSVWASSRSTRWGEAPMDYVFCAIFIIYTLEIVAKVLVSGFVINPREYSTLNRSLGLRKAMTERGKAIITPQRQLSTKRPTTAAPDPQASILRTFTGLNQYEEEVMINDPLHKRRVRLAHRAFLRHSFNRVDFVALVSYWISFWLSLEGLESRNQLYVFRMLSCLRILRLLSLTNGTSVIIRSLKKAAPLLGHVAFLISFFWLLFAIVGVQSFKSSLRRTCVWVDPEGQSNFTLNDPYNVLQFCGGYLNASTGAGMQWLKADGSASGYGPKGYLCPQGSLCVEGDNPYNATMSFDNIANSLELVFVVMSSNTFTDILYYTTDSDYLASALFFALGIVILGLWLVNLLVAVITHSFQVIREESKRSAFAVKNIDNVDEEDLSSRKVSTLKRVYDRTEFFWVCLITFDLVVQAMRSASMGNDRTQFIENTEIVVTLGLLLEIIIRFVSDWRAFHTKRRNWVDLGLVVVTCIIQVPAIKNHQGPYAVLTLFQILRVYRVVLAIPVTRNLILVVFSNTVGLLNLIVFVFLITFLAAIFASQLFRGQIPEYDPSGNLIEMDFSDIYLSFLGMYQLLSSENWTTILYNATAYTTHFKTAWISAIFFILWFIVANFIVLNMFIAVIQESFDVSEDEKRLHQVKAFLEQKQVSSSSQGNLSLSTILKLGRDSSRYKDPLDHAPAALEMLLKDAVVREFLDEDDNKQETPSNNRRADTLAAETATYDAVQPGVLSQFWTKISTSIMRREPNPFYSKLKFSRAYEELDPKAMAREVVSAAEQRKRAQREYLLKHPSYNKSLFIFAPGNPIRKLCQRIVGPGRGNQRAEGVDPYKPVWYTFSAFIYAAIVSMVLLACITTPIYQRNHFANSKNWFVYTDLGFAVVFTVEAIIKVIADGFFWTPNAYFRGSWGFIDGIVLITLWISVVGSLYSDWNVSRAIGAFKALRALRLLNLSDSAKDTFHSVIIVGGWKVIATAAVSMSFLVPFAIYAVNLFNGQLMECNDGNVSGSLDACVDEYASSPYNWNVWAPRVAANPYYDFDNFGNSLFILFQIVSQEGWIDVQQSAMSITGVDVQPQDNASPANGLFFVVFNLLGAVFVLTLFVSVFMRNYTEQTGVAFLTAEQRSWLELRKLLRQISPSKRSLDQKSKQWQIRCYKIAVKKHGRWAKFVTGVLMLHLLLLVLEFYPEVKMWDYIRGALFFLFTFVYLANVIIRVIGLGWQRFTRSSWDLYSMVAVPGTFTTTILNLISSNQAILILNKLFLVSIALMLIPRNNQLDQLFKTAAASFTAIGNLLATWFVLFLVFAIALNQTFGLTKFGENETNNLNFRDVPKALIFLFRTSCGEGWNQLMEDFAGLETPFCTYSDNFLDNDCGSAVWARTLFIAWNIISMYIFVSLFVSLIFESFSYVYQRSSGLYVISREEIRRFKQAWATFDPDGVGYISKEQFPRLLGELSGIFAMRIYEGEFTIGSILEQCTVTRRDSLVPGMRSVDGVDLDKLSEIVQRLPVETIRKRRQRLNIFYEEVLVSADPVRGISFHSCLMILAHYNVISDSKSLRLEEFLRRRARLQRVEEAVRRNTVIGFFDTLYWSREFRRRIKAKQASRMADVPQFSVPEIFVDQPEQSNNENHGDHHHHVDGGDSTSAGQTTTTTTTTTTTDEPMQPMLSPTSPLSGTSSSPRFGVLPKIDTNLGSLSSPTEWSSISPSLSPRRMTDEPTTAYYGTDVPASPHTATERSRANSAVSVQDVMESLGNSAWGESIRRSFTQRRSGGSK
ncbi:hypothetical protein ASPZODRAFT_89183 [Penicilliopsis zonata CBS 506.65]|uniref:Calcium-channel protein CCH1 n=1 Tax=Penicilliopsis zonata CBS 506.65 TaxID=1073090 RepID=A0A1L9SRJ6_9EURO|nr:hypothetical protein ASPZODRAFT_89183 [Penicilliopsis zonata CBS 506.65]OJJ49743.1 hypothetical protein ASPZODRAFT_89183 [Penicilliopsis zonata CBS 506.65]